MGIRSFLTTLLGKSDRGPSERRNPSGASLRGAIAERMVAEYGGVLMSAAKLTLGAPESLLPSAREAIEDAIVEYAQALYARQILDAETYAHLRTGYSELAHFISDSEARAAVLAEGAMASGDVDRFTPEVLEAIDRHSRVMAEKLRRRADFDRITAAAGIRTEPRSP